MTLKRMDNVLIVVDDFEATKAFFIELGLKLERDGLPMGKALSWTSSTRPTRSGLGPSTHR
jgi:hypothetical protein